jgi:hypothetical protein
LGWVWNGHNINIFSEYTVFVFTGRGYPRFLVYSKECMIINVPTQIICTLRSIIPWQISASFPWKITTITSVSPLQLGFKISIALISVLCTVHDVTIKITSYQSLWRRYYTSYAVKMSNILSMFITAVTHKLKFCIFSVKWLILTFLISNVSCLYIMFIPNQDNIHTTILISPLLSAHWITFSMHSA